MEPKLTMSTHDPNPGAMVINPKNPYEFRDYNSFPSWSREIIICIRTDYIDIPFFLFDQEENLTRPREEVLSLGIGVETVKMEDFWKEIIISSLQTRPNLCQDVHLTEEHIAELIYRKKWPLTEKILTDLLNKYSIKLQ